MTKQPSAQPVERVDKPWGQDVVRLEDRYGRSGTQAP
jgi:hypothetical protein